MKKIVVIATIVLFAFIAVESFAQPGGVPGGTGPGTDNQPVGGASTPIDGGAIALLAGGALILYRKYITNKKEE